MKKITIIVPDKIKHSIRTFDTNRVEENIVTKQIIIKALQIDEYDENLYFPKGTVKILAIEDIEKE